MEVYPLAGIHPEHSDLPIICSQLGVAYGQLIAWIIESAAAQIPAAGGSRGPF
jgi:D-alanine-D-alanine ligase